MNKGCKVSIIIPCYNVEKYIYQCLESVLAQTYIELEVLCLDDASKDRTLSILKEYEKKDSRIKVLASPTNLRQGAQRNIGIRQATGKYIVFLDSDDWLCENAIEALVTTAECTFADVVVGDYILYHEADEREEVNILYNVSERSVTKEEYFQECIFACRKIFKTDFLRENNIKFAEGIYYEDTFFRYISSYYVETVMYINRPIIYYRRHENNTTARRSARNEYNRFLAYHEILSEAKKRGIDGHYFDRIVNDYSTVCLNSLFQMYWEFDSIEWGNIKNILKICGKNYVNVANMGKWKKMQYAMFKMPRITLFAVVFVRIFKRKKCAVNRNVER